ncbi:fibronectin type III domain-containing protein [Pseudomonas sp.]|uniref:fibronectin type III domain-containing protein n=1 Tax=Pseudomonas sp. TaxID=306 RepID=UPI00258C9649|nr:fibronectin type III domain-containing protein [Pseudomonas sp.]
MDQEEHTEQPSQEINATYNLKSWMADLHPFIQYLKLTDLSLPGTHNAGMDKEIKPSDSYNYFQDYRIETQLNNGIRVLDIRFRYAHGGVGGYERQLFTFHDSKGGRYLDEIKGDINNFLSNNPGEIVILAVHKFEAGGNGPGIPWHDYFNVFSSIFGSKLLPRSAINLTLGQIKTQYPGPRIILAMPSEIWAGRDNTFFWNKIPHEWAGDGLVDENRLKNHLVSVFTNPPSTGLWSMSATAYNLGGPIDIISKLCEWYPTGGDWQSKSSVINFDWVTRRNQQFIHQCIRSNESKAFLLGPTILEPAEGAEVNNSTPFIMGTGTPGATVRLYEGGLGTILYGTAQVQGNGIWSTRPVVDLPDGVFPLTCDQVLNGQSSRYAKESKFLVKRPHPPQAPSNFTFSFNSHTNTLRLLNWSAPAGPVAGYNLTLTDTRGGTRSFTVTTTNHTVSVNPNDRYQIKITAYNDFGESPPLLAEMST